MIPRPVLAAWRRKVPWRDDRQVAQDLLLSVLAVRISKAPLTSEHLIWRGGTCLHKLHLERPWRFSEDLDYVLWGEVDHGSIRDAITSVIAETGMVAVKAEVSASRVNVWAEAAVDALPGNDPVRVKFYVHNDLARVLGVEPIWEDPVEGSEPYVPRKHRGCSFTRRPGSAHRVTGSTALAPAFRSPPSHRRGSLANNHRCGRGLDQLREPGVQAFSFACRSDRRRAMKIGAEAKIQFPGERALRLLPPGFAHAEVVVDGPLHRPREFLDRRSLEVDLVSEVDHVPGEKQKFGVELYDAGVSLVLNHRSLPRSEIPGIQARPGMSSRASRARDRTPCADGAGRR